MRAKPILKSNTYKLCLSLNSYLILSFTFFPSVSAQIAPRKINPTLIRNIQTQQNQPNIPEQKPVDQKPPSQRPLTQPQRPQPLPPPEKATPPFRFSNRKFSHTG